MQFLQPAVRQMDQVIQRQSLRKAAEFGTIGRAYQLVEAAAVGDVLLMRVILSSKSRCCTRRLSSAVSCPRNSPDGCSVPAVAVRRRYAILQAGAGLFAERLRLC